jgi:SAM-dependent methyltransferase
MDVERQIDDEQARLWNGPAGRAWVEAQELLDQMLKPSEDLLVNAVSAGPGSRVLDVGCGTGARTVRAAFDPYVQGAEVRFTAACWLVGARAPSASAAPKETASP